MYNWKKLCSGNCFDSLREELCSGGVYILDNVKFPYDTCDGSIRNIEFRYFSPSNIELRYEGMIVNYQGRDSLIGKFFNQKKMHFESLEDLEDFLLRFRDDCIADENVQSTPVNNNVTTDIPIKPKMIYNTGNIKVNTTEEYCVIDKGQLISFLSSEIFGQDENIAKIAHLVCNHIATKHRTRPLSIFLYGPTGVGKSEIVKKLVEGINKQVKSSSCYAYRPFDCCQCQERHDVSRLIGTAPGYLGYDEPGVFSILEDNPNTVFVFEEIEKAALNVTEVIMQALDTGRQETNGKTLKNGNQYYDLSNAIIFFTSNIDISKKRQSLGFATESGNDNSDNVTKSNNGDKQNVARIIGRETKEAKENLAETGRFRKEVIGRMNAIIQFNPIPDSAIVDIAAKCISDIAEIDHLLYVKELEDSILQEFLDETADEVKQFGVRSLKNEAQYYFADALREFSHCHDDYTYIKIGGSLNEPEISVVT